MCHGDESTSEGAILSHWEIRTRLREEEVSELGLEGFEEKGIPSKGE